MSVPLVPSIYVAFTLYIYPLIRQRLISTTSVTKFHERQLPKVIVRIVSPSTVSAIEKYLYHL